MKLSKTKQRAEERKESDLTGADRSDIDYETEALPTTHIMSNRVAPKEKLSSKDWLLQFRDIDDPLSFLEVVNLLDMYLIYANA